MHISRIIASTAALSALVLTGVATGDEPSGETTVHMTRLDPHGKPSGVILSDGTELVGAGNERLTRVGTPGDPVRVTVGADEQLVLVNGRTFETATLGPQENVGLKPLVAQPIGVGGGPVAIDRESTRLDDASSLDRLSASGRVTMVLESRAGVRSGLLMEDGTQVHVVPRLSGALARIKPGEQLQIEGLGTRAAEGSAMWALSIMKDDFVYLDVERGEGAPEIGVTGPFSSE